MIKFEQNDKKLELVNRRRREFVKEHPECAEYLRPFNSIDDVFLPYNRWIENLTEAEKIELKVIPDGDYNFSGFYICKDHNHHYYISALTDYQDDRFYYDYGVVDNASQIIENCEIPDDSVVLLVPVFKNENEPYSGWRWHKWGRYYGVQEHGCEYLNDEENTEMIYCFSILKLSKKERL